MFGMRFFFALFLGLLIGSILLWGSGAMLHGWQSKIAGLIGFFVAGFVGMLVAKRRPVVYALILGVIPLSAISIMLAIRNGDPVIYVLGTNLKQISAGFLFVLAGSLGARFFVTKRMVEGD